MKKLLSTVLCLLFASVIFAQGIDFRQLSYEEALAKAKSEKKMLFVDCFASWCGPCKYMASQIFTQKEAGDYFNPGFVCVKYDMEKGEGPALKKKFGVKAYPTFLLIDGDGKVQHKIVGGADLSTFLRWMDMGRKVKTSYAYLDEVYSTGNMSKKQMMQYWDVLNVAGESQKQDKVSAELDKVLTSGDKMKKECWPFMQSKSYGTPDFELVADNYKVFAKKNGKAAVDEHLRSQCLRAVESVLGRNAKEPLKILADVEKKMQVLDINGKDEILSAIILNRACVTKDFDKVFSILGNIATNEKGEVARAVMLLSKLNPMMTKADKQKALGLEEKFLKIVDKGTAAYISNYFSQLKVQACTGIYFYDLSFDEALKKAKELRRPLFIDCYTSWCGPCRHMANTVFKEEKVGDFMNSHFVCLKIDTEKGEGPAIKKKYDVRAYPTFVFVNPDGSLLHKFVGSDEGDAFLKRVQKVFDENMALGPLERKYKAGNRDKSVLLPYIKVLKSTHAVAEAARVADELLENSKDEDILSRDYWFIFSQCELSPKGSRAGKYLLENREKFNALVGNDVVDNRLFNGYMVEMLGIIAGTEHVAVKRFYDASREVKALKLGKRENMILAVIDVAKAMNGGNNAALMKSCRHAVSVISDIFVRSDLEFQLCDSKKLSASQKKQIHDIFSE